MSDAVPTQPTFDWGATVYLSNDDSMSLASAQRLLYAMSRDVTLAPSEIRPHELLNYFSFDNVTPDADQMFDVLASAELNGDQLSVALAVKGADRVRAIYEVNRRMITAMIADAVDHARVGMQEPPKHDRAALIAFSPTLTRITRGWR